MNHKLVKLFSLVVLGGLLLGAGSAQALSTDPQQPIMLEADQVDLDNMQGIGTYQGRVVYRQGSIELTADRLVVKTDAERQLQSVAATGQPAKFHQEMDDQQGKLKGEAEQIDYDVVQRRMVMSGNAHFWQCGDEFSGSRIEYRAKDGVVSATKEGKGDGRVQVILQPRAEEDKKKSNCHDRGPR